MLNSNFSTLDSMLLNLYAASCKYQIIGLMCICEARMMEVTNTANCLEIYKIADLFESVKLKSHVMNYIIVHYVDVCATDQYKTIVSNYHQEEQCARIFNDMNQAVTKSNVYRTNCLNLIGMHNITTSSSSSGVDNIKTAESNPHRSNSTCVIS